MPKLVLFTTSSFDSRTTCVKFVIAKIEFASENPLSKAPFNDRSHDYVCGLHWPNNQPSMEV